MWEWRNSALMKCLVCVRKTYTWPKSSNDIILFVLVFITYRCGWDDIWASRLIMDVFFIHPLKIRWICKATLTVWWWFLYIIMVYLTHTCYWHIHQDFFLFNWTFPYWLVNDFREQVVSTKLIAPLHFSSTGCCLFSLQFQKSHVNKTWKNWNRTNANSESSALWYLCCDL